MKFRLFALLQLLASFGVRQLERVRLWAGAKAAKENLKSCARRNGERQRFD